jgi:hypothetical protein
MGDVGVARRERAEPFGSCHSPPPTAVLAAGGKGFHDVHDVHVVGRSEWTPPGWGLGLRTHAFEPDGRLWAVGKRRGAWRLRAVGEESGEVTSATAVRPMAVGDGIVAPLTAGPEIAPTGSIRTGPSDEPVRVRPPSSVGEGVLPTVSVPVAFPGGDDVATAHACSSPLCNPGARAPRHERFHARHLGLPGEPPGRPSSPGPRAS